MDEFDSAFQESTNNDGAPINWRYWVWQMPTLTAAQVARLMSGLDPDIFSNLDDRPNQNAPYQILEKARNIERLADANGMQPTTPGEWMEWAEKHKFTLHDLFRIEVEKMAREQKEKDSALADTQSAPKEKARGMTKQRVANTFNGLHFDYDHWKKYLASPPLWLKECRVAPGSKKASALWNPVQIAIALLDKNISLRQLDTVFVGLKDWSEEWREQSAQLRD